MTPEDNTPQQSAKHSGWYCRSCGFLEEDEVTFDYCCKRCYTGHVFWHTEDKQLDIFVEEYKIN